MCKLIRNYKESGRTTTTTSSHTIPKIGPDRRFSTGTLNRRVVFSLLILVAQALESEVEYRRQTDVNSNRIVIVLRTINLILLFTIDGLIVSGVGQYYSDLGGKRSLMLTPDKWYYNVYSKLPLTFAEMRLSGQYFATAITTVILIITIFLHIVQLYCCKYSRLLCMCYSFCAVPFSLFVFGLEMHYSTCPWINDFYRADILRRDYTSVESYFDTQCGISGWALAGVRLHIFSLLSCSLFISEGLVSAFFRSDGVRHGGKINT
ncbi:unnamed protein product [Thelazia callipaeda]|uniref:MARVEL domain-containing protein n=1 Tax=Thelazia callipaeda TaxID=103827 RepID=A0A0N5CS30_THECL|nr:unnamed protein product [Thelazia callipaeda]